MKSISYVKLAVAIGGCEGAGGLGTVLSGNGINTWYPKLQKPSFNPPSWVFGPVWTLLYALMGTALYIVSERGEENSVVRQAQAIFGIQLVLNSIWTYIFFGRRSPLYALVEIVFLWFAIVLTIVAFLRVSRVAALLLLPYLFWTSFAALLNFSIWRLNR